MGAQSNLIDELSFRILATSDDQDEAVYVAQRVLWNIRHADEEDIQRAKEVK